VRKVILGDAVSSISTLPAESIHLCITSPPYYNGREEYASYDSVDEYLSEMLEVFVAMQPALVVGGRVCVNIANFGRSPYIPLVSYLNVGMIEAGYTMRGEVVWSKGANSSAAGSTAWGSWLSCSNPTLRDIHEMILVYQWGSPRLTGNKKDVTITKEDFLLCTKSVWEMKTESAKRIGHPAPFPVELPRRLIELYSYKGNVVLDPFAGSCTTAVAAAQSGRGFVCIDRMEEYLSIGMDRIKNEGQVEDVDYYAVS